MGAIPRILRGDGRISAVGFAGRRRSAAAVEGELNPRCWLHNSIHTPKGAREAQVDISSITVNIHGGMEMGGGYVGDIGVEEVAEDGVRDGVSA